MTYVRVKTNDVFRVVRKFENRDARLLAIQAVDDPLAYHLYYSVEDKPR